MKQFIKFNFTNKSNIDNFKVHQKELSFKGYNSDNKANFIPIDVIYNVQFKKSQSFCVNKIPLVLPIKDMPKLLDYTLENLISNGVHEYVNIVVVDDRSTEDIYSICKNKAISYIRVNNKKGFNYSMLANIGAYIMKSFEFKQIIYWNSDMWVPNKQTIPTLISKHQSSNCVISGTKLLYPNFSWDKSDSNISAQGEMRNLGIDVDYRGKIQFGGSVILIENNRVVPMHVKRFCDPSNAIANSDCGTFFTTGAYSMIDLGWLCGIGGFNPSLSKVYNDVDICLRAIEDNKGVMYFGKNLFLYHHESLNLNKETKFDHQFSSDSILFQKLWNPARIKKILK